MTCPERSRGKRFLVLTAISALVLSLALTALAQRKQATPEESKKKVENPERSRGTELKLSDEQMQKLAAIHRQGAKERIRLNAERQIAHIELQELLQADQPNQAALDRKIDQLADLNRQLTQNRLQSSVASRSVLSKEQWAALKGKMEKRMMRREQRRAKMFRFKGPGRGFGPGMGPGSGPARPMDGESFESEEAMPGETGEIDDFEQFGFLVPGEIGEDEEPEFDMDFHSFEAEPEFEMNFHPSEPSDDGWQ